MLNITVLVNYIESFVGNSNHNFVAINTLQFWRWLIIKDAVFSIICFLQLGAITPDSGFLLQLILWQCKFKIFTHHNYDFNNWGDD